MPLLRNHYLLTPNRKKLRNAMTTPEVVLWSRLKRRGLLGYKFRRQHSIGPYILDFYCHALYLAIEVDGGQHFSPSVIRYDEARTAYLNALNVQVVRYTNSDVMNNLAEVIEDLSQVVRERRRSWPPRPPQAGSTPP